MKQFIFLVCLLLCFSCTKETEKPASIKVKTDLATAIEIRSSIDGITLWNNKTDTIHPNDKNEFLFTKVTETPEFISIKIGDNYLKSILLPGKSIKIAQQDSTHVFEGENKTGMQFLNDVKRPYFFMSESNKYKKDTTAIQVEEKISMLKEAELSQLQNIINSKEIDAELEEILKKEIDYFYALRTAQIIIAKQYSKKEIPADLLDLLNKTLKKHPLETTYKPSTWSRYAEVILKEKAMYEAITTGKISKDSLQSYYLKDELHPHYYNLINSYKNKDIVEKAAATYIISEAKQNKFEKSLISLYEQFQKEFPNSPYLSYLTPDIEKIRAYHEKISGKMPSNVTFFKDQNIASLDDLLPELKGDQYYVDLWATWCGPCKKEFQHNDALDALLKEKGYKKLYISLDKAEQRSKWEENIKYFDLSGLHLLASREFFVDFEKNHSLHEGYISIPQYLIIDKEGKLVTNNAPRPSQIDKLRTFLENNDPNLKK